jgi:hypothetical protein
MAAAASGLVALTLAAGCTSSGTPTAGPTSSDANPATSTAPKSEISDPLDLTKFSANTCGGLTDAQVAPYLGGVRAKNPQSGNNGPVCAILAQGFSGAGLGVGVVNIATPTQQLLYESDSTFPWREKIDPIAGYPAVNDSQGSTSTTGDCATDVAVNDKQSLHIEFTVTSSSDPYYSKPCTVSEAMMAALIQNIKSGGS